jgi:hypothetical protein
MTFGGSSGRALPDKVGIVRDLGYLQPCSCFRYLNTHNIAV